MGTYFSKHVQKIVRGVPPIKQFSHLSKDKAGFKFSGILIVFIKDFSAIYDSINGSGSAQENLLYKLLTICGNVLHFNKGKNKQVTWVEETRSTDITGE